MKDMYSFALSQEQHDVFYEQAKQAYQAVFNRVGIGERTFVTFASGGSFSKYSHEFQTLSEAGEDTIYLHREKRIAVNKEVLSDDVLNELGLNRSELEELRGIETGNIFSLGTKFSAPFDLQVTEPGSDAATTVIMGCYGIGISRVMGTVAELLSDDKGLVWPAAIAPFQVYLARLGDDGAVVASADALHEQLESAGVSVYYDDSDKRPGEKFADADLIGLPHRVVVSPKTVAANVYEYKARSSDAVEILDGAALKNKLTA